MVEYRVGSFKELEEHLGKLLSKKQERIIEAAEKAATKGVLIVKKNAPKAFVELAESVHQEDIPKGSSVVADAPHAAPVEEGTRPHTPPIKPLLAWVELKGLDDSVAYALQKHIAQYGSSPAFYMKESVPDIAEEFLRLIKEYLSIEENI